MWRGGCRGFRLCACACVCVCVCVGVMTKKIKPKIQTINSNRVEFYTWNVGRNKVQIRADYALNSFPEPAWIEHGNEGEHINNLKKNSLDCTMMGVCVCVCVLVSLGCPHENSIFIKCGSTANKHSHLLSRGEQRKHYFEINRTRFRTKPNQSITAHVFFSYLQQDSHNTNTSATFPHAHTTRKARIWSEIRSLVCSR